MACSTNMMISALSVVAAATSVNAALAQAPPANAQEPRSRVVRIDYGCTWIDLPAGKTIRVWQPVPTSDEHQVVETMEAQLPTAGILSQDARYGNHILYFQCQIPASGKLSMRRSYRVTRREIHGLSQTTGPRPSLTEKTRQLFLSANDRVPITGKPLGLIDTAQLPDTPLGIARALYNRVDAHVRYDKSRPGYGHGDALWVCDSRFGNCTDFHSLFIALARSQGIPARFEIGFPLPAKRGAGSIAGYHCWAWFFVDDRGWLPVDISEADKHPAWKDYYFGNLTADRVAFSVGRDINLVPPQDGPPLNYFVYPYAEVEGDRVQNDHIRLDIRFADQNVTSP